MKKYLIVFASILVAPQLSPAKELVRDCAGPERWAAAMAQSSLKNAGLLKNEDIDFTKTRVVLLANEKIKKDLYKQIQKITFVKKVGGEITIITENNASNEECSLSAVTVYVVSKTLDP